MLRNLCCNLGSTLEVAGESLGADNVIDGDFVTANHTKHAQPGGYVEVSFAGPAKISHIKIHNVVDWWVLDFISKLDFQVRFPS